MLGHVKPNSVMPGDFAEQKPGSDPPRTASWPAPQMPPYPPAPSPAHQGLRTRRPISPPPLARQGSVISAANDLGPTHMSPQRAGQGYGQQQQQSTPMRNFTARDHVALSVRTQFDSPQASATPLSTSKQFMAQKTPVISTPRRTDWDTEQMEEALRRYSDELRQDTARLAAYMIETSWKRHAPHSRHISTRNWFDGVFRRPVHSKAADTMQLRTKQVEHGKSKKMAAKAEKRENFKAVCIKTHQEPVPRYSFHHVEIQKNILSPNTPLQYVPHLRDLRDNEESKYSRWLSELEKQDKTSGFVTLSRCDKVIKTLQKEHASTLLLYLDRWLSRLSIANCTKATLIRYMASNTENVTPQQRSSILSSYHEDPHSPASTNAIRMFIDAFDRVFDAPEQGDKQVSLQEVLLLDKTVEPIVDSKKWMKDTPSQSKAFEQHQQTVESFLETYALLGCLICTGSTCEHGEYGVDNERKRFSVELVGGLSSFMKQRGSKKRKDPEEPCSENCYILGPRSVRAPPWSEVEVMVLKSHFMTLSDTSIPIPCTTAMMTGRHCWDVGRQLKKLDLTLPAAQSDQPSRRAKTLPWYDRHRKLLLNDWQEHTKTHEHQQKDRFDPCNHDGPCTYANCQCVQNDLLCERFCRCTAEECSYKFTGCACRSQGKTCTSKQKDRPCICLQLNRECDPSLCGDCGALARADSSHADNEALHATGCQNCSLQRGKFRDVVLGESTIPGAGYGLFAAENIPQDEFVIEYVGELISQDEGVRRESRRGDPFDETATTSYLFTLLEAEGIWVDAAIYGNLSRYINHADSNCNVTPQILYVNGEYRIKFSSSCDIKAGDELFFDYGKEFPNLTQKILQEEEEIEKEENARKKRRKKNDDDERNGRQRKKSGRKSGRRTGRPVGRPPGSKTRPKRTEETPAPDDEGDDNAAEDQLNAESASRRPKRTDSEDATDGMDIRPEVMDSQDDAPSIAPGSEPPTRRKYKRGTTRASGTPATQLGAAASRRRGRRPRWMIEQETEVTAAASASREAATRAYSPSQIHDASPDTDPKESSPLSMVDSMPDPSEDKAHSSPHVPGNRELRERRNLHIDMIGPEKDDLMHDEDDEDNAATGRHRTRRKPVRYHE